MNRHAWMSPKPPSAGGHRPLDVLEGMRSLNTIARRMLYHWGNAIFRHVENICKTLTHELVWTTQSGSLPGGLNQPEDSPRPPMLLGERRKRPWGRLGLNSHPSLLRARHARACQE